MKLIPVILTVAAFYCNLAISNEIDVGFEPFPPLINEDGSGYLIDLLNALTKDSPLTLNYQLMTYARAKQELKHTRIDLIGLTPKNSETSQFYQYAQELNWSFDTTVDIFSIAKVKLHPSKLPNRSIGTLLGNADFFSEKFGIAKEKFVEVRSLAQLIKMMELNRLSFIILFQ